jgi:3-oxoacyl-[acyl-carrier protein] reductase
MGDSEFKNKVILVTGASRGIGKALATAYSRLGARVIANYNKSKNEVLELVKNLSNEGHSVEAIQADVSKNKEAERMVDEILREYNHIDILINNAGIRRDGFLAMMSEEDWDEVMNINLKSVFNVTKWVSRAMVSERKGKIINISSVSALKGVAGQSNYSASKGGIVSFSRSIAVELARFGIQVNVVAPGLIETDMSSGIDENRKNEILSHIPLARIGKFEDVVAGVIFLSSQKADYITGYTLAIDGGLSI